MNNFELFNHWSETYRLASKPKLGQIAAGEESSMTLVYFSALQSQKFEIFYDEINQLLACKELEISEVKPKISKFIYFLNTSLLVIQKMEVADSFLPMMTANTLVKSMSTKLNCLRDKALDVLKADAVSRRSLAKLHKELEKTTTII